MFDPKKHPAEYQPTIISKLSAARRQLDCAIEMWFADKDQVSVHTLAVAAHQIIHNINEKTFPDKPLFLNTPLRDESLRGEFVAMFKEAANFFKHADRDSNPGSTIEFSPFLTQIFLIYSIQGLTQLGEAKTDMETVFQFWFLLHNPEVNPDFLKALGDTVPIKHVELTRRMKKREFLKTMLEALLFSRTGH